ncbi:hypothetical protein SAMN03159341_10980 [Paenibacillus sp. 1_12]|uniref:hypothetical protein n=1 Tax=Paenibacillus sp. 1_12 TaxID=1566278 RepID=UPI0008E1D14B|nr:hypothetical protein [Paenibacillus sp. 1_12]SFL73903.1 hypothetical protein SAMN03159341_10980 [Paenibacillus sp. 1_12]
MSDKVTLSTGVLTREPDTITAVINLANMDKNSHRITVEIWDWSSYSDPVQLPVLIGNDDPVVFPYRLAGNNLAVMYADLDESVDLYEIRIIYHKTKKIIVNCFGRSLPPYTSQQGNTVLQNQLIKMS